jgi:DNA-binding NarL/FixJ family response regulator
MPFAEHYHVIRAVMPDCAEIRTGGRGAQIGALAERLKNGSGAYAKMLRPTLPFNLNEREYMAACLAAKRLRNSEIAEKLCISEKTVRNCLSVVYQKVGAPRVKLAAVLDSTKPDWESMVL